MATIAGMTAERKPCDCNGFGHRIRWRIGRLYWGKTCPACKGSRVVTTYRPRKVESSRIFGVSGDSQLRATYYDNGDSEAAWEKINPVPAPKHPLEDAWLADSYGKYYGRTVEDALGRGWQPKAPIQNYHAAPTKVEIKDVPRIGLNLDAIEEKLRQIWATGERWEIPTNPENTAKRARHEPKAKKKRLRKRTK